MMTIEEAPAETPDNPRSARPHGRRRWLVLPALLILIAAGWWGHRQLASSAVSASTPASTAAATAPSPVEVETATAQTKDVPRYLLATGELRSDKEGAVAADATGKVVAASIERGMSFEVGQVLVQLDDRAAKLALREAEASVALADSRYALAKNDLERNQPLAEAHAIAASDLQRFQADLKGREAELQLARARLDTAKKTLDDTTIRAPFRGTVCERLVQVGEYVRADTAVARMADGRRLRLLLNIPEPSVGAIEANQAVVFSVSTFPGQEFVGKVTHIGPSVRSASRDLVIEVTVDNPDGKLRAGTFASAKVWLAQTPAVVIPPSAVKRQGEVTKVYVVQDGHAVEKLVELGESSPTWVEVRNGLIAKEIVVMAPGEVADGAPVVTEAVR